MSVIERPDPWTAHPQTSAGLGLAVRVSFEDDASVVQVRGDLDNATRNMVFVAATAGRHPVMVVDLAGMTFMDCSGYGCLVASRLVVEATGRSLILRGQTGQPARLLEMIGHV